MFNIAYNLYATLRPRGIFFSSLRLTVMPVAIAGGSGSTGVNVTSGGVHPTGVSAIVGAVFLAPQFTEISFDQWVVFQLGVAAVVAAAAFEVAAGLAGVAVGVAPEVAVLIALN